MNRQTNRQTNKQTETDRQTNKEYANILRRFLPFFCRSKACQGQTDRQTDR